MAVYKIPQDVEADDKFLGPLSFKQFIFAGVAIVSAYLCFLSLTKGFWPALIVLFPFVIMGGFLGFPWGRDQPTEIWLAARIRFALKPRVRIWNQSDINELVTINVPKKIEKHYTDGLSKNEVTSRLSGLATLLDSRGWAVKNAGSNVYDMPMSHGSNTSDRLLDVGTAPMEVADSTYGTDVLDEASNNTALHFEELIKNSEQKHRQEAMGKLAAARTQETVAQPPSQADFWYLQQQGQQAGVAAAQQPAQMPQTQPVQQNSADFWFLGADGTTQAPPAAQTQPQQPQVAVPAAVPYTTFQSAAMVTPSAVGAPPQPQQQAALAPYVAPIQISAEDEQALLQKIHNEHDHGVPQYGHLKTIQPLGVAPDPPQTVAPVPAQQAVPIIAETAVTPPVNPAIINLANNDDLSVATLARQANKQAEQRLSDGEVVISLH